MPFTKYAIDTYISEHVSNVTQIGATDVSHHHPNYEQWISGFGLSVIFLDSLKPESKHLALQFIRRTVVSLNHYSTACVHLEELVVAAAPKWSPYFLALSYFEDAVGQLYQAMDISRKAMGVQLFEKNDASLEQRLNTIYNTSKHCVPQIEQPVWLTNSGLECAESKVSFLEIEDWLRACARISEQIAQGRPNEARA